MKIQLQHAVSNSLKEVKYGFSWTSLFFGPLVPLLRGDIIWVLLWIILTGISILFFWIIFPFIYNKMYIKKLLEKGYKPANKPSEDFLVSKRMILKNINQENRIRNEPIKKQTTISKNEPVLNVDNHTEKVVEQQVPIIEETSNDNSQVIENIINKVLTNNHGRYKNVYSKLNNNIPDKLIKSLTKNFQTFDNRSEDILLGIEGFGTFLVITNKNYYLRLTDYVMEMFKKNYTYDISLSNLLMENDNLSGTALFKCIDMKEPKKPIGCFVDMAYPLNKNKKEDITIVFEVTYELNNYFFGDSAKKPAGIK